MELLNFTANVDIVTYKTELKKAKMIFFRFVRVNVLVIILFYAVDL